MVSAVPGAPVNRPTGRLRAVTTPAAPARGRLPRVALTTPSLESLSPDVLGAVGRLYEASFPPEERTPFTELQNGLATGLRRLWLEDSALAFAVTTVLHTDDDDLLLEYIAVDAAHRSEGIGQSMIRNLLDQHVGPIVLEVEDPAVSSDPYAVRRIEFYERLGARRIPFSDTYEMPELNGDGVLPMRLLDLAPERRAQAWRPELVRHLVTHIWTDAYALDPQDTRLRAVLQSI